MFRYFYSFSNRNRLKMEFCSYVVGFISIGGYGMCFEEVVGNRLWDTGEVIIGLKTIEWRL